MLRNLGSDQALVHGNTNSNTPKLVVGVSCAHRCIIVDNGAMLAQNPTGKYDQPIVYAFRLFNKNKTKLYHYKKKSLGNGLCFAKVQTFFIGI